MKTKDIFPKGEKVTEYFTGEAWLQMLSYDISDFDTLVYNVTFAPGSRNYWHSHPGGQILLCTSGEGCYQEKGRPVRVLRPGDVVEIKPGILHWHGAASHNVFTHVGITPDAGDNKAVWHGPVTDEQYKGLEE